MCSGTSDPKGTDRLLGQKQNNAPKGMTPQLLAFSGVAQNTRLQQQQHKSKYARLLRSLSHSKAHTSAS